MIPHFTQIYQRNLPNLTKFECVEADMHPTQGVAGIYILMNEDEIVYVGHSGQIGTRLASHRKSKTFTHYYYFGCSDLSERLRVEGILILSLRPTLNKALSLGLGNDRIWEIQWRFPRAKKKARKSSKRKR